MKKHTVFLLCLCAIFFAGCGKKENVISQWVNAKIEDAIMKYSAIEADESYIRYEQISKEEEINPEGYFYSDEVDYSVLEDQDAVHVTFAVNSYITVSYYDDPAMSSPLNPGGVYLHANDCIYADIQEINNPNTSAYRFDGFEVWVYDENGKKEKELETASFEDGLVIQIPMNFNGKEISIIPLGEYTACNIDLHDYILDVNGVEKELAGTWVINNEETTYNSASVSPVGSCTVTYTYDPELYVFVRSAPSCLYHSETEGMVVFEEYAADENIDSFSVELHKKNGDQAFDPGKYKVEHADIEYSYQGVAIESPVFIPNGGKIVYEITHIDDGYWAPGDQTGEFEIGDADEVTANLICKKEKVRVTLPQPDRGGEIIYSLDGQVLDEKSVEALIGSEIVMTFQSKSGWTCDAADGSVYKVIAKEVQKANVDGKDVNEVFWEQQYKPDVSLTINKNVGTYTEFAISAVDVEKSALKLDNIKKNQEVFKGEVGTANDLTLTAQNGALLEGEALKVEIEKETIDGRKENDIRYLTKLPESLKVSLYIEDSSTVYKTVKINVEKVRVLSFSDPGIGNGKIIVATTDLTRNQYLKAGDVIEGERKVKITISAKNGYYIKDSGKTELYSDTMTYSQYVSDREKIISKHPVKKLCSVMLDGTDPYGEVTYKIDGKVVEAGNYMLKEEQKLEMIYEITDGKHVVAREGANWFENSLNMTKSKTKETVRIPITSSLDGAKVTRDTYIHVNNR